MKKTYRLVILAMFVCIELVLMLTPLGYIPIGPIRATTMHIPVILAGLLLGKKEGALIGFVFGLTSIVVNTLTPTVVSFVFTPFYSIGGISGNGLSLVIALVPRILLGYVSGWLNEKINVEEKITKTGGIAMVTTLMHTLLVLGGIYVFFGKSYALAREISYQTLASVIGTIILTNGIMEAILASTASMAITQAVKHVRRH